MFSAVSCHYTPQVYSYSRGSAYKYELHKSQSIESEISTASSWEEAVWGAPEEDAVEPSCIFSWNREVEQLEPFLLYVEEQAKQYRLEANAPKGPLLTGTAKASAAYKRTPKKRQPVRAQGGGKRKGTRSPRVSAAATGSASPSVPQTPPSSPASTVSSSSL